MQAEGRIQHLHYRAHEKREGSKHAHCGGRTADQPVAAGRPWKERVAYAWLQAHPVTNSNYVLRRGRGVGKAGRRRFCGVWKGVAGSAILRLWKESDQILLDYCLYPRSRCHVY